MTDVFSPERDALAAVTAAARAQLAALADASPEAFDETAARTLDAVADLDRARRTRERRVALPGAPAAAPAHRAALEAAAREAQAACDALEAALASAVTIGRELMGAWQTLTTPATSRVYSATGAVGRPGATSGRVRPSP